MTTTDEILTGEGVLLDARPATFASRIDSGAIDALITLAVGALTAYIAIEGIRISPDYVGPFVILWIFFMTVGLPTLVETITRGYSVGKRVTGLRVVRDDGGPIVFRQAFTRALIGLGEIWLTVGSVAVLTSIFHPKGKRIGDILAGTYVARVRSPKVYQAPITMPPHLASWARTADIRRLPDSLALAARQYLTRGTTMSPQGREQLGRDISARLAAYVAPAPPPSSVADFVSAVIAERRQREYALVSSQAADAERRREAVEKLPFGIG